jgi:ABC-type transport system involved in multi-copper enzyme maturation permease subunit
VSETGAAIYSQGYRRWEARGPLSKLRFWPITREALRLLLARKAFLGLMMMSWVPFVGFVIYFWARTQFAGAGDLAKVLPADGSVFDRVLSFQLLPVLIISTFGGAGLVANDLRTGAILVYLSRPLTRRDYVLGKLAVLLALNASVTLVPGLLLYAVATGLSPDRFLTTELWALGPKIAVQALLTSAVMSLCALAISALSRSARVAGIAFFGLMSGLEIARNIVSAVFKTPHAVVFTVQGNLRAFGHALFGVQERWLDVPLWESGLALALIGALCLLALRSRVRAVEIVR